MGKSTIGLQASWLPERMGSEPRSLTFASWGSAARMGEPSTTSFRPKAATAIWHVFRAHGAQFLILNGPVNNPAELATYRTALSDTRLRATRLLADRDALTERVHARLRGEMAPLAGDALVGRPTEAAETVVNAALWLQDQAAVDSAFPALDTTRLDSAESARRVLAGH